MESVPPDAGRVAPDQPFEEILRENGPRIRGFILKMTGDPHAADDLCQEVFVRAYRTLHTLLHREKLRSWLFAIGYHVTIDWMRRNASDRRLRHELEGRASEAPAWTRPMDEALRRERERRMNRGIAAIWSHVTRLPPSYRRVIEMRYREEMSIRQIAEKEGVGVGNVKVRLHRARRRLRRDMEEWAPFFRKAM